MIKYQNTAISMSVMIIIVNLILPVSVIGIITSLVGYDRIFAVIAIILVLGMTNLVYFYLLHQWYITYYDDKQIKQKWFKKIKVIEFKKIKYLYFIDDLIIVTEKKYVIPRDIKKNRVKMRLKREMKNELNITISPDDKYFASTLILKATEAEKININVKTRLYKEMFELN